MRIVAAAVLLIACVAFVEAQRGPRPPRPGPEDEASRLIRLVGRAQATLKYSGMRVTTVRLDDQVIKNEELIWRDGIRQRTEFGSGSSSAGEVIVTDGRTRWHFFPKSNEIHVKPAVRERPFMRMLEGGPRRDMRLVVVDGGRMLGSTTRRVDMMDGRGNRAASIWINPSNGMVLKRENFDPTGRLVGAFEFKRIDYSPDLKPSDFVITRKGAKVVTVDELLRNAAKDAGVPPISLSPRSGFALDSIRVITSGRNSKVLLQSYTSDNGRVSVFLSSGELSQERLRATARGRMSVYVQDFGAYQVALVGDRPEPELRRLAEWLMRDPGRNAQG